MHESSLIPNLIGTIERVAQASHALKVTRVSLSVGEFAAISPTHLRAHLVAGLAGTVAAGADLHITLVSDPADPLAYLARLASIEITEGRNSVDSPRCSCAE